jgi:hypothetical protein
MKTIQSIFVALLAVTVLASCGGGLKKTKGGLLYKIIPGSKGKKYLLVNSSNYSLVKPVTRHR